MTDTPSPASVSLSACGHHLGRFSVFVELGLVEDARDELAAAWHYLALAQSLMPASPDVERGSLQYGWPPTSVVERVLKGKP